MKRDSRTRMALASVPRILCADDQADVLEALRLLLKSEGFEIVTASSPAGVLAATQGREFDAVLMDLNYARDTTSGGEGLELLDQLQAADPLVPIVVMTAWGSVDGAVEAMRRGARDYVQKPWDNARLLASVRTQVELGRALKAARRLESEGSRRRGSELPVLVASARAMQPVMRLLERIGPSEANVLITGSHGSGKDVVARWLHAASPRASKPFVAVNAGGLADGVFESELFGHVRGAFTDARADRAGCFELADGGTLFLDEVTNMPLGQQAKLLRVLQTGEFHPVGSSRVRHADVRVLTATNVKVADAVAQGRFREDLFYRLNTVEIELPPLRERREDIPELAARCLARQAARYGKPVTAIAPDAMSALLDHAWPGNVRELEHVLERAVLMSAGGLVTARGSPLARARRRGQGPGRHDARAGREAPHRARAPARRQRKRRRQAPRALAQRALPPAPALRPSRGRMSRRALDHPTRVFVSALVAGLPAIVVALFLLGRGDTSARVFWTLTLLLVSVWLGFAAAAREAVVHQLHTAANLLAALREGDFSVRGRHQDTGDALGGLLAEVNALGETLRTQRLGAVEAAALLSKVMARD